MVNNSTNINTHINCCESMVIKDPQKMTSEIQDLAWDLGQT